MISSYHRNKVVAVAAAAKQQKKKKRVLTMTMMMMMMMIGKKKKSCNDNYMNKRLKKPGHHSESIELLHQRAKKKTKPLKIKTLSRKALRYHSY